MTFKGFLKGLSLNWQTRKTEITLEVEAKPEDVEKLKDKVLTIELKQFREKRSLDANAYYWQLVTKVAEAMNVSKPWAHNYFLRKYGQREEIDGKNVYLVLPDTDEAEKKSWESDTYHIKPTSQVKAGNDGLMYRTYVMLRGSSDYDTYEMSVLINGVVEAAKELGIETLTPDELERMMATYEKHYAGR